MKELSSAVKPSINGSKMIEWRRNKILELSSQGHNQLEIAGILKISEPTVSRDISYLRNQAKNKIKKYIDQKLPEEYEKCLVGLNSILREAWTTTSNTSNEREKIQALSLAKECYSMKLELLTNATVVDDAIRFVTERTKLSSRGKNIEEYKEPDYDHESEVLEEEQEKDTEETEESLTTNQVF